MQGATHGGSLVLGRRDAADEPIAGHGAFNAGFDFVMPVSVGFPLLFFHEFENLAGFAIAEVFFNKQVDGGHEVHRATGAHPFILARRFLKSFAFGGGLSESGVKGLY